MARKSWIFGGIAAAAGGWWLYKTSRAGTRRAPYTTLRSDEEIEIRSYPELTIARTAMSDDRGTAFRRLFNYIDRGNAREEKIAMTTPVLFDRNDPSMSFVLPSELSATLAPQATEEGVTLTTLPAGNYVAIRFRGNVDEDREREAIEELREWMEKEKLPVRGEPIAAYYDSPMTPGPLRRNEILIRTA